VNAAPYSTRSYGQSAHENACQAYGQDSGLPLVPYPYRRETVNSACGFSFMASSRADFRGSSPDMAMSQRSVGPTMAPAAVCRRVLASARVTDSLGDSLVGSALALVFFHRKSC